jgi:hypothetical protein
MSEEERPMVEGAQPDAESLVEKEQVTPQRPNEPVPPGRLARWSSTVLRWGAGLGVVFVLGVALVWFTRVRPQTQELRTLSQTLQETQQQLDSAQAEVENLRPLKAENADLTDQLAKSQKHLALLSVLVDVTSAQLAVVEDNPLAAQAALKDTDSKLGSFQAGLEAESAQTVKSMRDRLGSVMTELGANDQFAAKRDLEVIANTLVDLESSLFLTSAP